MVLTSQDASAEMLIIGQRMQALRRLRRVSQTKLAKMVGTSPSQISVIESNKSGPSLRTAIAIARALDTSVDFLTGAVDDPRPAAEMLRKLVAQDAELFRHAQPGAVVREDQRWKDFIAIAEVDTAAGAGAVVHEERITGRMKFPARWLRREGLNPDMCRIIRVVGESMEPMLPDGCSILVNRENRKPADGRIFVIRTEDELIVKRTLYSKEHGWLLASDNANGRSWPTRPWRADTIIVGEVRWVWFSLP